jgi:hypothetical protein
LTAGDRARTARGAEAIGALSRIDNRVVQKALGIAKSGRVFDLGLELNARIPHNPEFVRFALAFTHTPEVTGKASAFQYAVESIFGALHIGTHIDAFIHVQKEVASTAGISPRILATIAAGKGTAWRLYLRS